MDSLILYLAKSSLGIALFYSTYWLFLRKQTFFNANRLFLLLGIIIPVILPCIEIHYNTSVNDQGAIYTLGQLDKTFKSLPADAYNNSTDEYLSWINIIGIIYLTGITIFFLRLLWQTIELLILIQKNGIQKREGLLVVENKKYGLPFSFINLIFLNPTFHSGTDLNSILTHEKVHIREKHWFDLLLVELATVFFWFNPFAWLFERSIKQNHEYLADQGVLAQGHSVGRYQSILINQIMGMQIIGLTNNLNYSLNKKRMTMMTKTKTSKKQTFKMLWALPAIAFLLLAFAKPNYLMGVDSDTKSSSALNGEVRDIFVTGTVLNEKGEPIRDVSVIIEGTTIGTSTNYKGIFEIKINKTDKIFLTHISYSTLQTDFKEIEKGKLMDGTYSSTFNMKLGVVNFDLDNILKTEKNMVNEQCNPVTPPDETFLIVEEMPSYPRGMYAFAKEVKEKISKLNPKGKIQIDFTIKTDGTASPVYVAGNVSSLEDLTRIIFSFNHKWNPGKQRGVAVPVNFSITTNF